MTSIRMLGALAAILLLGAGTAAARTLAEVEARRTISMCANPNFLPYSAEKGELPGFQIEIGRAIAEQLGVSLTLEWIVPRRRAAAVNCDMLLDTIGDPALYAGRLLLTKPYHKTGVALGVKSDGAAIQGFGDLQRGQKTGVMVGSLASIVLGKRGVTTSPYAFEQDMIEELARGQLFAAAASPASLAYYAHIHPQAGIQVVHAYDSEPELAWIVAIGLRQSDEALLNKVNAALERLLADGTISRIYARYGVEHRAPAL